LWSKAINDQLQASAVGIICLTQENKVSPWIMFEAGALAKGLDNVHVCPLLIDLRQSEVKAPLSQFNLTDANKDGIGKLVKTLNDCLADKGLSQAALDKAFDMWWPSFEEEFGAILMKYKIASTTPPRKPEEIQEEILSLARTINNRIAGLESGFSRLDGSASVRRVKRSRNSQELLGSIISKWALSGDLKDDVGDVDYVALVEKIATLKTPEPSFSKALAAEEERLRGAVLEKMQTGLSDEQIASSIDTGLGLTRSGVLELIAKIRKEKDGD
jgi:hypothetical protein